ncbi:hypothetical protein Tco_1124199 [Tanacetum coccineum]|uniref:Uncharacterized protein n=1 Tax=Tanacetum coccineum TaxID=301880 RepID=A0ABQ5J9E2_9ASTR
MIIDEVEEESAEDALRRKKGKDKEELKDTANVSPHEDTIHAKEIHSCKEGTEYTRLTFVSVIYFMCIQRSSEVFHPDSLIGQFLKDLRLLYEPCRVVAIRTRDHEYHHDDDVCLEGESSAKRQKTFERGRYTTSIDDDEVPSEEVLPELLAEVSGKEMTTDDLQRIQKFNVMMRSQYDLGKEHQYHLDQIKSYIESQIVWESRKEDLTLQIPKKPTQVFQSCEKNPKIPSISLVNQDIFYLNNGNSETRKYVPSLHKIHAFLFPENDLEELNSRWVKKTIKRLHLYTRYVVDHWKSP